MTAHEFKTKFQLSDLGKQLKLARERRYLNIENVAAELRIHPGIIWQIEQDLENCNVQTAYLCGYLRSYAQLVHVDQRFVDHACAILGLEQIPTSSKERTPIRVDQLSIKDKRINRSLKIAGCCILMLMLTWWVKHHQPTTVVVPTLITGTVAAPSSSSAQNPLVRGRKG